MEQSKLKQLTCRLAKGLIREMGFGEADDKWLMSYCSRVIFAEITANLCRPDIPEAMEGLYTEMVAGEYLRIKFGAGELNDMLPKGMDPAGVTGVKVGDISVSLKAGASAADSLEERINELRWPRRRKWLYDLHRMALK